MNSRAFMVLTACAVVASGCANREPNAPARPPQLFNTFGFGPPPPATPAGRTVTSDYVDSAAVPDGATPSEVAALGAADPNAPSYVANGYATVYRLCNNYFDDLTIMQNEASFTNDLVTSAGTAAAAIMALAKASTAAVGITAAGTGLISSVIQSYNSRALMTPYPTETKALILTALAAYERNAPPSGARSKLDAISMVQHYAEICTYSGISRFAKMALTSATVVNANSTQPSSNLDGIASTMSDILGVPALTPKNIEDLYYYIAQNPDVWTKDAASAKKVLALLPAGLSAMLTDDNGTPINPASVDVVRSAKTFLTLLYGQNASFKSAVDAETAMLTTPAKTPTVKAAAAASPAAPALPPPANTPAPGPAAPIPQIVVAGSQK